jgi:hypothetical protein
MKLIFAIVHDEDSPRLMAELNRAAFVSPNSIRPVVFFAPAILR